MIAADEVNGPDKLLAYPTQLLAEFTVGVKHPTKVSLR
jgi:hypothetical protein